MKQFGEFAKKIDPLLGSKTRDGQKIGRGLQECIVILRAMNNMDLSGDTGIIEIEDDHSGVDTRNERVFKI